jgi:hypothetical protein
MTRLRALIPLALIICASLNIKAQNATTLKVGSPIERTLAKGETHEFAVSMDENGFAQLIVEQRGIDVVVDVSLPSGNVLREFDTPNGAQGPEHVSFVALTAGSYRIAVSALDSDNTTSGQYQIQLVEVRPATDQELKTGKNQAVAKDKGVALLSQMDGSIAEIKSPITRIQAQLRVADLLWEFDEKRSSKYLSDAVADTKEYIALLDANSEEYAQNYQYIAQLRYQIVQELAEQDPDAALSFLRATAARDNSHIDQQGSAALENTLELTVASMVMENDPNRALQIVRENLKKGYSASVLNTLTSMAEKNRDLASQLAHEIAAKLLGEQRLIDNDETANVTMGLLRSFVMTDKNIQIRTRQMAPMVAGGLISEDDYKQLLQKALSELLAYKQSSRTAYSRNGTRDGMWTMMSGLHSLGADIDKVVPGGLSALQKKQTELTGRPPIVGPIQDIQTLVPLGPVETALETIEKAPAETREQLYIQLAHMEARKGETARARQIINDHITNPYQRKEALRNIEQQEITGALSRGKAEEALRNIAAIRNPKERAARLAEVANQIVVGQQRATALGLLEQARTLLGSSPQAQDQNQMRALLEIARAFSQHDSKRSFDIVEPLIDQFSELCAAARVLEGFGPEFFEGEELNLQNGNTIGQIAQQLSNVLGTLALTNFDRAKASSDKVQRPEVRVQMYLEIAAQAIDNAP